MTMLAPEATLEEWRNVARSRWSLTRIDQLGHRVAEMINGGQTFTITPQERRINEGKIVNVKNNPFRNGTFKLMRGVDGDEDTKVLEANPNAIDDDAVEKMFQGHHTQMVKTLKAIDSLPILRRILAYGDASGASTKRLDQVRARILEVDPDALKPARASDPLVRREEATGPDGTPLPQDADYYELDPQAAGGMPARQLS